MKGSIFLLILLFSLQSYGKEFGSNSCLETKNLSRTELFEALDIEGKEAQKRIVYSKAKITKLAYDGCKEQEVGDFWLRGGVIQEAKIYFLPLKAKEGLCKSKYLKLSGNEGSWDNLQNEEGFVVSKNKNCLNLPISEYIEIHSLIPDESINKLLSSVELAKKHLQASEKISVENIRVLALGIRKFNDQANYYIWLGIPKSSAWYELPVRLNYSDSPVSFSKIHYLIQ